MYENGFKRGAGATERQESSAYKTVWRAMALGEAGKREEQQKSLGLLKATDTEAG